jgi:hypothetical protein
LAATFAELARAGWIRESSAQATESGHWVGVIASIFKQGVGVVDIARGEALARQVGFGQERVCDDKKAG